MLFPQGQNVEAMNTSASQVTESSYGSLNVKGTSDYNHGYI